jgi:predicted Kef-type K+ transport protein
MPLGALWMLELSYALGCLTAGVVTAAGARERRLTLALVVGGIFTVLGFVNLTQFPAPLWLAVVTTVTYVPATLVGALSFSRLRPERTDRG